MIDPQKIVGIAFVFSGLGLMAASLCFWRVANILQDVFRLIKEL